MHIPARTQLRTVASAVTVASSMAYLHAASAATALQNFQGNIDQTSDKAGVKGTQNDLGSLVGTLIGSALGLLGIIFVVLTIYAGYLWMTAQGDDKKVGEAKKIIQQAAVGLVVIFSAYVITETVIRFVGQSQTGQSGTSDACLLDPSQPQCD